MRVLQGLKCVFILWGWRSHNFSWYGIPSTHNFWCSLVPLAACVSETFVICFSLSIMKLEASDSSSLYASLVGGRPRPACTRFANSHIFTVLFGLQLKQSPEHCVSDHMSYLKVIWKEKFLYFSFFPRRLLRSHQTNAKFLLLLRFLRLVTYNHYFKLNQF